MPITKSPARPKSDSPLDMIEYELLLNMSSRARDLASTARDAGERLIRLAKELEESEDPSFNDLGVLQGTGPRIDVFCGELGAYKRALDAINGQRRSIEYERLAKLPAPEDKDAVTLKGLRGKKHLVATFTVDDGRVREEAISTEQFVELQGLVGKRFNIGTIDGKLVYDLRPESKGLLGRF